MSLSCLLRASSASFSARMRISERTRAINSCSSTGLAQKIVGACVGSLDAVFRVLQGGYQNDRQEYRRRAVLDPPAYLESHPAPAIITSRQHQARFLRLDLRKRLFSAGSGNGLVALSFQVSPSSKLDVHRFVIDDQNLDLTGWAGRANRTSVPPECGALALSGDWRLRVSPYRSAK